MNENQKIIPLLGAFRVGTNFARTVLELNYEVKVDYNLLGWKHGMLPTLTVDSGISYPRIPPLVIVKDPFAVFDSWYNYAKSVNKNIYCNTSSFSDFLRSEIIFRDDFSKLAPDYYFSSPVEMWNSVVWNHISYADRLSGMIVRYEDMLEKAQDVFEKIALGFSLKRKTNDFFIPEQITRNMSDRGSRVESENYLTKNDFKKKDYFSHRRYLEKYTKEDLEFTQKRLSNVLLKRLQYDEDHIQNRARNSKRFSDCDSVSIHDSKTSDYEIFTLANVDRISDLLILLESNLSHDSAPISVIPFDERVDELKIVCDIYGAKLVDSDPEWDELGQAIFKQEEYRPKVPAWRYFRKFNAFGLASGNFFFLDANTVITGSLADISSNLATCDMIFGCRSLKYRNFTRWGSYILNQLNKEIKNGYNAGFICANRQSLDLNMFQDIKAIPGIRKILSVSPEQSVLSLVIALQNAHVKLISDVVPNAANLLSGGQEILNDSDQVTLNEKKVYAIKWSGAYHHSNKPVPGYPFYSSLAQTALNRISSVNPSLGVILSEKYVKMRILE